MIDFGIHSFIHSSGYILRGSSESLGVHSCLHVHSVCSDVAAVYQSGAVACKLDPELEKLEGGYDACRKKLMQSLSRSLFNNSYYCSKRSGAGHIMNCIGTCRIGPLRPPPVEPCLVLYFSIDALQE